MKIDHVTAVVGDVEKAKEALENLFGIKSSGSVSLPGMSIATFEFGSTELHVNAPVGAGVVEDYYRARGAGVHHIAIGVDDIDAKLAELGRKGIKALGGPVETAPGLREVFIDPAMTGGILFQLVERRGPKIEVAELNGAAVEELAGRGAQSPSR